MFRDQLGWVRLNLIEGIGVVKKLDLLRLFSSPEEIFQIEKEDWLRLGLRCEQADNLLDSHKAEEAKRIVDIAYQKGVRIISIDDEEYPEMLKYIHDPPLVLYVKGVIPKETAIGVVGSRKASGYGMEVAFKLASELTKEGCVVVSGMARGIDTAAHSGALHSGGQTIAVLGCGPDKVYPPENKGLMERITEKGAVLSEYPPGTEPATYHFPTRNRIISGISFSVLVVEAGVKSGSLITAQTALEQGREVFAVPGNINHYNSMGTNKLIKEGAKLVLSADDILEEIPWRHIDPVKNQIKLKERLSEEEEKIIRVLRLEDLYQEQIENLTNLPLQTLYTLLLELELKGMIQKDLTGRYRIAVE